VFDSAQRPLDLVQIDHTKLDIIVVDDEQRLPIGRPRSRFPLSALLRLAEVKLARKILGLSDGTIGEISALLTCAALAAIERGMEQITSNTLDDCGYVAPRERRRSAALAPT
jgi:hypothetical protein